ncbi:Photosystem I reaction center subunit III [Spirulina sp. CS-785/01]|uniref:Photosystem I reaction center subunit III n=1 Tax=Spirulina sp. CS-785/01 TaxID=3021716 RepID=UPI00232DF66F|nr:Photosystem I reaction center subunit III [Spirulina sp. CS-785/01]MDB9313512.1 Photosystem I reaction center subunit III [Spirulina sp. CS-785/01]
MRKILALLLVFTLWFNFAPTASADEYGLVPCSESAAYQQRAKNFRDTTADPQSGEKRADRYSEALCGPEGLPHLIVDGRLSHAGDFIIPSILFLYIAGWIGWVGRAYLISIRDEKNPEDKEIILDVPRAFKFMVGGFLWPLAAVKEFLSGELTAQETEIPISPR